jgi:hypothetical protein
MFDFNTIDPEAARARIAARPELPTFLLAGTGVRYDLRPRTRRAVEARGTIAP